MLGMHIAYLVNSFLKLDPYIALPLTIVILFGLCALLQHFLVTSVVEKKTGHESQIFLTLDF